MSLRSRLSYLSQSMGDVSGSAVAAIGDTGRDTNALPGVLRETPFGRVRVIVKRYPVEQTYGKVRLDTALECSGATIAALALDESLASVDLRDALFLDTETTGLAGGTGTLPFLTGVSWFEDDELVVEQYFVEEFGKEAPLLAALSERLKTASCVVTFNGKSFDWPLIRTRFVMNRMPSPPEPRHFDLLHTARRILKRRLKSMRLVALEEAILGHHRVGDVDGAEIPEIYFNFLATGVFGRLEEVVRHNELDLLAMPALAGWLGRQYNAVNENDHPLDWIGVARVAERSGDVNRARRFALAASEDPRSAEAAAEGHIILAHGLHVAGDYASEVEHLERAASFGVRAFSAHVHLRLAITFEHKLRCFDRALTHAPHTIAEEGYLGSHKRQARLTRRLVEAST